MALKLLFLLGGSIIGASFMLGILIVFNKMQSDMRFRAFILIMSIIGLILLAAIMQKSV